MQRCTMDWGSQTTEWPRGKEEAATGYPSQKTGKRRGKTDKHGSQRGVGKRRQRIWRGIRGQGGKGERKRGYLLSSEVEKGLGFGKNKRRKLKAVNIRGQSGGKPTAASKLYKGNERQSK